MYGAEQMLQQHMEKDVHLHLKMLRDEYNKLKSVVGDGRAMLDDETVEELKQKLSEMTKENEKNKQEMHELKDKMEMNVKQTENIFSKLKRLQSGSAPRLESVFKWERLCEALGGQNEIKDVLVDMRQKVRSHDETLRSFNSGSTSPLENQLNQLNIRVADTDRRLRLTEATSTDGELLWKIDNYRRRLEEARSRRVTSFYSQPFYTSRYGYKMCARVYLNGDGAAENQFISLFFVLMKGKFDDLLKWPFQHKVTLMIMNLSTGEHKMDSFRPDRGSASFQRPVNDMNVASGSPKFIKHSELENNGFLSPEHNFYVKIVVDTSTS